jgi:hypothetical protein
MDTSWRSAGFTETRSCEGNPICIPSSPIYPQQKCVAIQLPLSEYRDFADAYRQLGRFLDDVYDRKRIHSSLDYLTPTEFEQQWLKGQSVLTQRPQTNKSTVSEARALGGAPSTRRSPRVPGLCEVAHTLRD